jgi:ubiquinol-cytochrome c reductase cytochrome b subunit
MTDEPPGSKPTKTQVYRPGGAAAARALKATNPTGGPIATWLDRRTGYSVVVKLICDEPIPGGARWWYVFGAVLTFLLALEFLTGVLLASAYAPSTTTAWASTAFIQDTLTLGWFIRGLHSFGSSAMIVLAGIHLAQVLIFGAYKAPRELNWLIGLAMLGLLMVFALTGYGLPWDERGYWAKQVETSIIGTTPLIGPWLQSLLQGGSSYGNYTLTHLYTLHTYVLPATIVGALVVHILLVRKHGVTPRWGTEEATLAHTTQTYWPHQAIRDTGACAATFIVLALMVIRTHGAELDGPVDPVGSYQARPEWYSLPLYQLRTYFEGSLEMLATMVIPGMGALLLAALPWLDRGANRDPRRRLIVVLGAAFGAAALGVLGYLPLRHDRRDPAYQTARAASFARAKLARTLAKTGVLPEGGMAVFRNDPSFHVRELWNEHCATCHTFTGEGGKDGPDLKDYNSRQWIESFLRNPEGPQHMGGAKFEQGMKPVDGTDDEFRAVTELVYAETGAADVDPTLVKAAVPQLSEKDCDSCHDLDGTSENTGPNLKGRGTLPYIVDIISDAGDGKLFGKKNKMPRFAGKLAPEDIGELARFVLAESRRQ